MRHALLLLLALCAVDARATTVFDLVPRDAPNCAFEAPPADAGIAVTPGGFVIVHPRNAALSAKYTGCKSMWVDSNPGDWQRFATLYFENGQLRRVVAQDARQRGAIRGACGFPLGNSLMPGAPRDVADPACAGVRDEPFYGLHLPTWPRACATQPDRPACRADPS